MHIPDEYMEDINIVADEVNEEDGETAEPASAESVMFRFE